jgi:hypothetical protein
MALKNFAHPRQRLQKDRCDLKASKIACGKDKNSGLAGSEGADLQRTISQLLILGENNPARLSSRLEPDTVLFIASEMIVVNLNCKASFNEFGSDWLDAKKPVYEEYRPFRRLRIGWLLRSH